MIALSHRTQRTKWNLSIGSWLILFLSSLLREAAPSNPVSGPRSTVISQRGPGRTSSRETRLIVANVVLFVMKKLTDHYEWLMILKKICRECFNTQNSGFGTGLSLGLNVGSGWAILLSGWVFFLIFFSPLFLPFPLIDM